MSSDPSPLSSNESPQRLADTLVWLTISVVGVAIFSSAAIHIPQEMKRVPVFCVVLGLLAGWGLAQFAGLRKLPGSRLVIGLIWVLIVAGEVLAAIQTHRLGVKPDRTELKPEQFERDLLTARMKEYYAHEPDDLSDEDRDRWREGHEFFERGEKARQAQLDARRLHRSFYGYLAGRIPSAWGKWNSPWPAVFWGVEILAGSTLGAWLAFWTLRGQSPPRSNVMTTSKSNAASHSSG